MVPDRERPSRVHQAVDLFVVVGGAVVAVSAAGALWSYLRVGGVVPAYVREAQFLAGLVVLLVWTVRNRRGRGPDEAVRGEQGVHFSRPTSWRFAAYNRFLGGPRLTVDDALGTDAYLLGLGAVLVALSLGVELLGPLPG